MMIMPIKFKPLTHSRSRDIMISIWSIYGHQIFPKNTHDLITTFQLNQIFDWESPIVPRHAIVPWEER